ncbi:zinc metalloproteinase-disintegrin-like atragin isoform X4 [Dermacentor silvarum]|nr:zinc metalloproteinase-disintegrin-like atragin isoform X4 [Dermacentor silvarum]
MRETTAFASILNIISYKGNSRQYTKLNVSDLGGKVYTDPTVAAVLLVAQDKCLLVKGFLGNRMRITHYNNATPDVNGCFPHILTETNEQPSTGSTYRTHDYDAFRRTRHHFHKKANIQVNARTASGSEPVNATVEAVAVISKEYADSFNNENDHKLKALFQYLRVFFAAVNLVFTRTETNRLDLKLVVTAVVILSRDTEIMAERHPTDNELILARTPSALNHFIRVNRHIFGGADVAIYLSKRKFARQMLLDSNPQKLKGIAYLGAACTSSCGALIYDDFKAGWNVAAHEILHLLGADHDGVAAPGYLTNSPGAEDCPESEQHIMTTRPSDATLSLSTCTLNQVLAFLGSERGRCLLDSESRKMPLLTETDLRKPLEDASKYCKNQYMEATNVEFVANYSEEFNIDKCVLVCATTDSDGVRSYNIVPAPDYIFCGMAAEVPQACIGGICREVPARPKPFHEWLKDRISEQFEMRTALNNK